MNLRTVVLSPRRMAAGVVVSGLLFSACGGGSGPERADAVSTQRRPAATVEAPTDIEILWIWLAALPANDRNDVMLTIVPDVHGALAAIVAGMVGPGVGH